MSYHIDIKGVGRVTIEQMLSFKDMVDRYKDVPFDTHRCQNGCCVILHFENGEGCIIHDNGEAIDRHGQTIIPPIDWGETL